MEGLAIGILRERSPASWSRRGVTSRRVASPPTTLIIRWHFPDRCSFQSKSPHAIRLVYLVNTCPANQTSSNNERNYSSDTNYRFRVVENFISISRQGFDERVRSLCKGWTRWSGLATRWKISQPWFAWNAQDRIWHHFRWSGSVVSVQSHFSYDLFLVFQKKTSRATELVKRWFKVTGNHRWQGKFVSRKVRWSWKSSNLRKISFFQ